MRSGEPISRDCVAAFARALAATSYVKFRPQAGRIVLPDVRCDLVWAGERLFIQGPMSKGRAANFVGQDVELLNLGAFQARDWLNLPLSEIADVCIPLGDILPEAAKRLAEVFVAGRARLLIAPAQALQADCAVAAARALRRGRSVARAAEVAQLSERQLERVFDDAFGMRPKRYARIVRFRRAVLSAKAHGSIADAAAAAGYVDQSHFHKDALSLVGATPRAVLPRVGNVQDAVVLAPDNDA